MKYTKIPETTFQEIQLNAGVICKEFTLSTGAVKDIIGASSGGWNFSATPTYSDMGDDIDNCPKNTMELKQLDRWEVKMSGTYVTVNADVVKNLIAVADIDETDATHIIPRNDILDSDFTDLWWVGDYSDKNSETGGGFIAIHMIHTLSTGGFQIKSSDRAKGQFSAEYTAHYSIGEQDKVPFEVYVKSGTADDEVA